MRSCEKYFTLLPSIDILRHYIFFINGILLKAFYMLDIGYILLFDI